jgi:hypothetical protein
VVYGTHTKWFTVVVPDSGGKRIGIRAVSIGQHPRGLVNGHNRPDYVRLVVNSIQVQVITV